MNSREIVLKALYEIEENGGYFNSVLSSSLAKTSPLDQGLVTELIYGVTKNRFALDHIIMQFSRIKLKKMTPWIKNILRMGIYQMYFMDKIPHSAACNECVKLSKKYAHTASSGFVNGVLRSVSRNINTISFPSKENPYEYLSVKYSYPLWLTKKLVEQYGFDKSEDFMKESNKSHPVNLRVNNLLTTRDELISILSDEGISACSSSLNPNCLTVEGKINIDQSPSYKKGLYSLQNISSFNAVCELAPISGDFVMDICAAPGGKSCATAELMKNIGTVLSFDIYEHKIELIKKSAARLGINIISVAKNNGCELLTEYTEKADKVILDAPCSGIGVIHKKPDIKWTRQESDIAELSLIQTQLINTACSYVKHGGILMYCTCTILKEENEDIISKFLKTHNDFSVLSQKQVLTGNYGESGFYTCKMKRN